MSGYDGAMGASSEKPAPRKPRSRRRAKTSASTRDHSNDTPAKASSPTESVPAPESEELVYGINTSWGDEANAIFLPRRLAESLVRYCEALSTCKRWGEVRALLEPPELEELYRLYSFEEERYVLKDDDYLLDEEGYPVIVPPPDDALFDRKRIVALSEGDWPVWPETRMYHGFPPDLAREFGEVVTPMLTDFQLAIPQEVIEEVAERFRQRGFRCVRDDALITSIEI